MVNTRPLASQEDNESNSKKNIKKNKEDNESQLNFKIFFPKCNIADLNVNAFLNQIKLRIHIFFHKTICINSNKDSNSQPPNLK